MMKTSVGTGHFLYKQLDFVIFQRNHYVRIQVIQVRKNFIKKIVIFKLDFPKFELLSVYVRVL